MHLKAIGMEMPKFAKSHKGFTQRMTWLSAEQLPAVVPPKKGQKAQVAQENIQHNLREPNMLVYITNTESYNHFSKEEDISLVTLEMYCAPGRLMFVC